MSSNLPKMWKAVDGEEFAGVLATPDSGFTNPRTIRGMNVIDVIDNDGQRWTSPTASKLSELLLRALLRTTLLKPGCQVWWACEGELPSRRGSPYKEFSIRITDGDREVFEHLVIYNPAYRKMVRDGKIDLKDALKYDKEEREEK